MTEPFLFIWVQYGFKLGHSVRQNIIEDKYLFYRFDIFQPPGGSQAYWV
jgi:hypothetical protein